MVALWVMLRDPGRPPRHGLPTASTTISYDSMLGLAAVALTVAYPLVAVARVVRNRTTIGLSPVAWVMTVWLAGTWLQFGVRNGDGFQMVANGAVCVGALIIVLWMAASGTLDWRVVLGLGAVAAVNYAAFLAGTAGELAATAFITMLVGGATVQAIAASPHTRGVSLIALLSASAANICWVIYGIRVDLPVLAAVGATAALAFGAAAVVVAVRRRYSGDLDALAAVALHRARHSDRQVAALALSGDGEHAHVTVVGQNNAWRAAGRSLEGVDVMFLDAVREASSVGHAGVPGNPSAMLVRVGTVVLLYVAPNDPLFDDLVPSEDIEVARAAERAQFSATCHDFVLSDLHAAHLLLERASLGGGLTADESTQMTGTMRRVVTELRGIIAGVDPDGGDIGEELDRLLAQWDGATRGSNVEISGRVSGEERPLPGGISRQVIAVAREGIANAVRHANASHISVEVRFGEVTPGLSCPVTVVVTDDGVGRPAITSRTPTSGVANLTRRVVGVGGELRWDAGEHGTGTRLVAFFPGQPLTAEVVS